MKMKKYFSLLLSIFASSNLCFGMEYNVIDDRFETGQFFDILGSKNSPYCLGSGCSAYVIKSIYNGRPVAVKVFKPNNSEKSRDEIEICKKIYEYSKENSLNPNLMKVLGITCAVSTLDPSDKREAIIFELIDGMTFTEWKKKFKFDNVDSFIHDFCVPLIQAFQEYYTITGELKHEVMSENIMMRKNGDNWEPVLIDYGPGSGNPIYWLYDTLCRCCLSVNQDNKLNGLYNFLDAQRSKGNIEMNISLSNELLEEIKKIRNQ